MYLTDAFLLIYSLIYFFALSYKSVNLYDFFKITFLVKRSITDHFHKAMDDSCQEGTAFCWMACRPLANNGTCGYGDMMVCWSDEKNITCGTSQGEKKNLDLLMMDELILNFL